MLSKLSKPLTFQFRRLVIFAFHISKAARLQNLNTEGSRSEGSPMHAAKVFDIAA